MGYCLGPNLHGLIQSIWYKQEVVMKVQKFFGHSFGTERGGTKEDPVSPTICNILVEAVVRAVLLEFCRPQESHQGVGFGGGITQHHLLCGQWPHRRLQPHLVPDDTESGGKDFQEGGTKDKPW